MYDVRDLGSFAIMLLVLPLFAVVFAASLVLVAPIYAIAWLVRRTAVAVR